MLEHQGPEHGDADRHQVSDRVVGLDQLVDAVREELERALGERVDDESFLGSEQAVHGPGRGPGLRGHRPHRQRGRSPFGDESFRGRPERGAGAVIVLAPSTHP